MRSAILLIATALLMGELPFTDTSTMSISGTSTVHDWTCQVGLPAGAVVETAGQITGVTVSVETEAIECGKGLMNRKLRKALKADDHPVIRFESSRIERDDSLRAHGTLFVAGSEHAATVTAAETSGPDGRRFTGSLDLSLEALGVDAPTAMLGTIKTGDAVSVHFDVAVK